MYLLIFGFALLFVCYDSPKAGYVKTQGYAKCTYTGQAYYSGVGSQYFELTMYVYKDKNGSIQSAAKLECTGLRSENDNLKKCNINNFSSTFGNAQSNFVDSGTFYDSNGWRCNDWLHINPTSVSSDINVYSSAVDNETLLGRSIAVGTWELNNNETTILIPQDYQFSSVEDSTTSDDKIDGILNWANSKKD